MTLTAIFKKGHRNKLLGVIEHLFPHILHLAQQSSQSTLMRKLNVKLFQRMGMACLPPRVVSWAYQRGQRSLLQNIGGTQENGGKQIGAHAVAEAGDTQKDDIDDIEIPEQLEDIVEQLLVGLRDRDTIVRWSAAKGIGRITSRLPKDLGDDVVAAVFELFSDNEGDGAWHGGCLAMAELARRGLLLPFRLPEAVPVVVKAIQYDVRRGSNRYVAMNVIVEIIRRITLLICTIFLVKLFPSPIISRAVSVHMSETPPATCAGPSHEHILLR